MGQVITTGGVTSIDDKEGRLARRAIIENYQAALQDFVGSESGDVDSINDQGLTEYLIGGAYTRVLRIPADTTIVSKIWNRERLWIIIEGVVAIQTETGSHIIEAPYIGRAPFGSKVALYAQTEVLWAAITGAPEAETLEQVEEQIIADDYSDLSYPWDQIEGSNV